MALVIVIGLSLTVGIVGFSLNKSKNGTMENVAGFHKYTTARNIAHTAVNMALRALDRNDSAFIASRSMSVNLMGGTATISYSYPNMAALDTIDLTATARFMDTTRSMVLRLRRQPVPFPVVKQAVGLRVPNVDFRINSASALIDGRNHTTEGVLASDALDKPAFGVITAADTTKVNTEEARNPGEQIIGPPDAVWDTTISNPADYVNEYINAADQVFNTGVYGSNMTWGSASSPKIIFANGNVTFNGSIDGWGILVVDGNLTLGGNFKFRGLVICKDDVQIDVTFVKGSPEIIGGVLMTAPSGGTFDVRGNSKIFYSSSALEMAKYINKLQVYRVLRWYE